MKAFLHLLIPVFALTVYAYCLFLFCSFAGADVTMDYSYFAVLAGTVFACVVNYRLSLREHTLTWIALVNIALIVLVEIVGFASHNEINGIALSAIAAVLFLIPVPCSLYLCRHPIRANTMLLFCELSVFGTVVFLLFQLGYFDAPVRASVLSVVCLVLNLFLLSVLRTEASAERKSEAKKQIERGVILAAVLACSVFAAGTIVLFVLPGTRSALLGAAQGIGRFFVFLGKRIGDFLAWLAEVLPDLPQLEGEALSAESPPSAAAGEMEAMTELSESFKIFLIVVIAAVIIGLFLVVLIKMRRTRLLRLAGKMVPGTQDVTERGPGLAGIVFAFLRRVLFRFVFARRLFARRDTCEGFFVRLSRSAKRKGYGRAQTETAAAYLNRLSLALTKADSFAVLDVPAGFFAELAAQIDRRLYAPGASVSVPVNRDLARRILRAARKMR